MDLNQFQNFCAQNQLMIGLIVTALIATSPENLPAVKDFPGWLYGWLRSAALTFMNFKHEQKKS